jgi:hypothetical protein
LLGLNRTPTNFVFEALRLFRSENLRLDRVKSRRYENRPGRPLPGKMSEEAAKIIKSNPIDETGEKGGIGGFLNRRVIQEKIRADSIDDSRGEGDHEHLRMNGEITENKDKKKHDDIFFVPSMHRAKLMWANIAETMVVGNRELQKAEKRCLQGGGG